MPITEPATGNQFDDLIPTEYPPLAEDPDRTGPLGFRGTSPLQLKRLYRRPCRPTRPSTQQCIHRVGIGPGMSVNTNVLPPVSTLNHNGHLPHS